jgi:hypothetical protein
LGLPMIVIITNVSSNNNTKASSLK